MRLSVVVPVFNQEKDVVAFVESVENKLKTYTKNYDIIITTNQEFDYVESLHNKLPKNVHLVAVKLTDDYQQVVMAGVDRAEGDATIIMTPEYDVDLMDDMIHDWKNGRQIVCLRRKHSKFGHFITKIRLRIYNLFLFLFGDIFSIGILKDAQLLDKEIVDKMKAEQDMAHRFRTMYAPLDYNTSVHDIEHPIEKFETKGTPQIDFWLGAIGAFITFIAFITCIALGISLAAPIWVWTLFVVFFIIFEFLFVALLVNATARVKIGILHNVDGDGKIYNLAQEYFPEVKHRVNKTVQHKESATTLGGVSEEVISTTSENVIDSTTSSQTVDKLKVTKKKSTKSTVSADKDSSKTTKSKNSTAKSKNSTTKSTKETSVSDNEITVESDKLKVNKSKKSTTKKDESTVATTKSTKGKSNTTNTKKTKSVKDESVVNKPKKQSKTKTTDESTKEIAGDDTTISNPKTTSKKRSATRISKS